MTARRRTRRHPSTAVRFDWDEHNEAKLARRNITPGDVEEVFEGAWGLDPLFKRNKRAGTARWMMFGRDRSGRRLRIGVLWADEEQRVLRAIHGIPVT